MHTKIFEVNNRKYKAVGVRLNENEVAAHVVDVKSGMDVFFKKYDSISEAAACILAIAAYRAIPRTLKI